VLRSALSHAMSEELISRNVAAMVKTPTSRSRKAQAWSSEEARRFLESARHEGDPLYALYVLVLVLGLRKGEVLGLRWDDVDFDSAELTIELQLQRVRRQLLHRETKTEASDATLPLPAICIAALRLRHAAQGKGRDADPPARGLRCDHGGLHAGVVQADPRGAAAAGGEPRMTTAVLRCCTDGKGAASELRTRPLTWSGWRDLNPRPLRPERSALPSCATPRCE